MLLKTNYTPHPPTPLGAATKIAISSAFGTPYCFLCYLFSITGYAGSALS